MEKIKNRIIKQVITFIFIVLSLFTMFLNINFTKNESSLTSKQNDSSILGITYEKRTPKDTAFITIGFAPSEDFLEENEDDNLYFNFDRENLNSKNEVLLYKSKYGDKNYYAYIDIMHDTSESEYVDEMIIDENDNINGVYYSKDDSGNKGKIYDVPLIPVKPDGSGWGYVKQKIISNISYVSSEWNEDDNEEKITINSSNKYWDIQEKTELLETALSSINLLDSDNNIISTSTNQVDEIGEEFILKFDGLTSGMEYNNVHLGLQNYEDKIKSEDFSFTTKSGILGLKSASLIDDSETKNGFQFKFEATSDDASYNSSPWFSYGAEVFANGDDTTPIFATSNDEFDTLEEQKVTIDTLPKASTYTNVNVQLFKNDNEKIGEPIQISDSIVLPHVIGLKSASFVEGSETKSGFQFKFQVNDSKSGTNESQPWVSYGVEVFADGDDTTPIFTTAGDKFDTLDEQTITIDTLSKGSTYTNVNVQLFQDIDEKIGEPIQISDSISLVDEVSDIDSCEVIDKSTTTVGFSFKFKAKVKGSLNGNIDSYGIKVFSEGDEIYSTNEDAFNTLEEQTVVVNTLIPGTFYNSIFIQLFNNEGIIGSQKKLSNGIKTLTTKVNSIKSGSIVGDPTLNGFKFKFEAEILVNSNGEPEPETVAPYGIKVFADGLEVFSTDDNLFTTLGEQTVIVDTLESGTIYKDVKIQIFDSAGPSGPMFDLADSVKTPAPKPTIDSIEVIEGSITSDGFSFNLDVGSTIESNFVQKTLPFKVELLSSGLSIWTSENTYDKVGTNKIVVHDLDAKTEYLDLVVELVDEEESTVYSKKNIDDSIQTLDRVKGANEIKILNRKQNSFEVELNVYGSTPKGNDSSVEISPYYIAVFANGNDNNPIWMSENSFNEIGKINFVVDGLEPLKKYSDLQFKIVRKDGIQLKDTDVFDSQISIKTKISTTEIAIISSVSTLVFIIIVIIVIIVLWRIRSKGKDERNFKNQLKTNSIKMKKW